MAKYPIYGYEKPYLEEIKKEISEYADEIYYDDFDNLCVVKNSNITNENTECILLGICVSENAFLISDVCDNANIELSPLMKADDSIFGKRIVTLNGKTGIIKGTSKKPLGDFGYNDKKTALKYIKPGDVCCIKPFIEQMGDSYITNCPSLLLKNIFVSLIKEYYNKKIIFAFLRETKKGAYALGKHEQTSCDKAYFVNVSEEATSNVSFVKKEGSFISPLLAENIPPCITEKDVTNAGQFYLSGKCEKTGGIVIKCEILPDKSYKVTKKATEEFKALAIKL